MTLWQTGPTLANRGLDRLWPNRLWPILAKFSTQKAQIPNPKTCIQTWTPNPPSLNPKTREEGARQFGAHPSGPHPLGPPSLLHPFLGHTYSGFGLHSTSGGVGVVVVVVVVVVVGSDPWTTLRQTTGRWTPPPPDRLRRTTQNFALVFPLPPPFCSFSVSLGVFSLNFDGVLEAGA